MFQIISALFLIGFAVTSAFSFGKAPIVSSVNSVRSLSSTSLFAIWDLNLQRLGKGYRCVWPTSSPVSNLLKLCTTSFSPIITLQLSNFAMIRNLQGDDTEVPVIPTVGEEVTSKGAKKAVLKGPGVDERCGKLLHIRHHDFFFCFSAILNVW